ncbi:CDP-alcohol phosphatidyltransferase family protein [Ulvibacterium sp.]|uniref:CDP-alcohol phosphatidyltransferase family protein n=1 Tax=Ulvibacterium sp. TaxID=2665914 RepID=UPI003BAB061F
MKRHIPNLITLLNVLCGCIATVFAVANILEMAALFVCLGIFLDFLDGLAARLLRVKSELGVQLDSLADMITSGLVPGIVMFQLLNMSELGGWNMASNISWASDSDFSFLPFSGFLITLASAYRLAKFNIDENQVNSFIGLPTPANALLIISLPLILLYQNNDVLNGIILNQWFLISLTLLSGYLLNSRIELFALKFENWGFKDNALRYIFIIISLVVLITMRFLGIPLIIVFYVLGSWVQNLTVKNR